MDVNLTTVLVAAASGGGGVLIVRELIGGFVKMGRGVAGRISNRQQQVAVERDAAVAAQAKAEAERDDAERRVDVERRNRRNVDNYAWQLEHLLAANNVTNTVAQPVIEDTMTAAQVRQIRGGST